MGEPLAFLPRFEGGEGRFAERTCHRQITGEVSGLTPRVHRDLPHLEDRGIVADHHTAPFGREDDVTLDLPVKAGEEIARGEGRRREVLTGSGGRLETGDATDQIGLERERRPLAAEATREQATCTTLDLGGGPTPDDLGFLERDEGVGEVVVPHEAEELLPDLHAEVGTHHGRLDVEVEHRDVIARVVAQLADGGHEGIALGDVAREPLPRLEGGVDVLRPPHRHHGVAVVLNRAVALELAHPLRVEQLDALAVRDRVGRQREDDVALRAQEGLTPEIVLGRERTPEVATHPLREERTSVGDPGVVAPALVVEAGERVSERPLEEGDLAAHPVGADLGELEARALVGAPERHGSRREELDPVAEAFDVLPPPTGEQVAVDHVTGSIEEHFHLRPPGAMPGFDCCGTRSCKKRALCLSRNEQEESS